MHVCTTVLLRAMRAHRVDERRGALQLWAGGQVGQADPRLRANEVERLGPSAMQGRGLEGGSVGRIGVLLFFTVLVIILYYSYWP